MDKNSKIMNARIVEVIEIKTSRKKNEDGKEVCVPVKEYWSLDGKLLFVKEIAAE